MLSSNSKKPRERFYLLPGQGGRNFYRKQQRIMRWTISVSVAFGLILAAVMWYQARIRL